MGSARIGEASIVRALIVNGVDINSCEGWEKLTALMIASSNGHPEIAQMLIENSADVDAGDCYEKTALAHASENGHTQVAQMLIENRAGIDTRAYERWTALMRAAYSGHAQVAQMLIENRASVDTR